MLSERHQRAAARCLEEIVVYDYRKGSKAKLPPFMIAKFTQMWRKQEEAKARKGDSVRSLFERVARLEKSTWDREDAVEDIGEGRP